MITAWLLWLAVLVVGGFAVLETIAFRTDRITLSRLVWNISKAWPPFPWVVGNVTGGLAVHFWWNWCPGAGLGIG
jgi:hypothetical protein